MSSLTEEQYAAGIPKVCFYQGLEDHMRSLGLCWGLVHALEQGKQMDCSNCDLATRKTE